MFFLFKGIYIIIEAFFDLMLCYYYVKHHLFQHLYMGTNIFIAIQQPYPNARSLFNHTPSDYKNGIAFFNSGSNLLSGINAG